MMAAGVVRMLARSSEASSSCGLMSRLPGLALALGIAVVATAHAASGIASHAAVRSGLTDHGSARAAKSDRCRPNTWYLLQGSAGSGAVSR